MATRADAGDGDSSRAALVARAASSVGGAIARAHAASLSEAGDSPQGRWILQRLNDELEAARTILHRVLADGANGVGALQLAELFELCRIWRDLDPEFAAHEPQIVHELTHTHGIAIRPTFRTTTPASIPPERKHHDEEAPPARTRDPRPAAAADRLQLDGADLDHPADRVGLG